MIAATSAVTIQARPGLQFSDDGIVWDNAYGLAMNSGATYATAAQWNFGDSFFDTFSNPGGALPPKLFVRFGILCSNSSGSSVQSAVARMRIDIAPQRQGTLVFPQVKVFADSTTHSFYPLSPPIPAEQVAEIRGTFEIIALSSDIYVRPAWQQCDNPRSFSAPPGWTSATEFESSAQNAVGLYYGGAFASISPTQQWVRFGLVAYTGGASTVNAAIATLRVLGRVFASEQGDRSHL